MRATPLWAGAVLAVSLLPELALFLWMGGMPGSLAVFLGMRLLGTGPLVLGSAALAHAIEHRRRARVSEAELTEARLAALTAQLRPHFLFNTLQSVSTLVHRDPEAADAMIGRLGELLRASLEAADTPLIPLEEELRLTAAYLEIMRERFGERLRFSIEAGGDPGLWCRLSCCSPWWRTRCGTGSSRGGKEARSACARPRGMGRWCWR
jgi:hypothetical protein